MNSQNLPHIVEQIRLQHWVHSYHGNCPELSSRTIAHARYSMAIRTYYSQTQGTLYSNEILPPLRSRLRTLCDFYGKPYLQDARWASQSGQTAISPKTEYTSRYFYGPEPCRKPPYSTVLLHPIKNHYDSCQPWSQGSCLVNYINERLSEPQESLQDVRSGWWDFQFHLFRL